MQVIAYLVEIWESQLKVDYINVGLGVDFSIHMNYIIIFKTANNLKH